MSAEKKKLILSLIFPSFFLLVLWLILITEIILDENFSKSGIYPRELKGISGVLTSPLIHGSISHLVANSPPLFILGSLLFYFYSRVSYKVFFLIYLLSGICVWIAGRQAWHIGASGVVYGLFAFLFTSGIIIKNYKLLAVSLLVVFLYGGMIWGIFPTMENISFESHLLGLISGIALALFYRKEGPKREIFPWELEEDNDEAEDNSLQNNTGIQANSKG